MVRDRLPAHRYDLAQLASRSPASCVSELPAETQYKILRGNAERLYPVHARRTRLLTIRCSAG